MAFDIVCRASAALWECASMVDTLSDEDLQQRLEELGEHIAARKRRLGEFERADRGADALQELQQRQRAALDRLWQGGRVRIGAWAAAKAEIETDYRSIVESFREWIFRHDRDHGAG